MTPQQPTWVPQDTHLPCMRPDSDSYWFSHDPTDQELAKEACSHCPIVTDCLEHALTYEEDGIWGGTDPAERRRIRRGRRGIKFVPYMRLVTTEETA